MWLRIEVNDFKRVTYLMFYIHNRNFNIIFIDGYYWKSRFYIAIEYEKVALLQQRWKNNFFYTIANHVEALGKSYVGKWTMHRA